MAYNRINKIYFEMRKKREIIRRQIRNIFLFGFSYEFHLIQKKLRIIQKQPLMDIIKRQEFFEHHKEQIPKEVQFEYESIMCISGAPKLNLEHPKRFTEKIQYMKLYENTEIKTLLADKYKVRDWIKDKIGEEYLIPLYGVWNNFKEIDFERLPNTFVLKCNHGSAMTMVVRDKNKWSRKKAEKQFEDWMNTNYAYEYMELHYKDIPRKIIAEEYVEEPEGGAF